MDSTREAGFLSAKLDAAWDRRKAEALVFNLKLASGEIKPGLVKRLSWSLRALSAGKHHAERRRSYEARWRDLDGRKQPSLTWALNDTFGHYFWGGGAFKVVIHVLAVNHIDVSCSR